MVVFPCSREDRDHQGWERGGAAGSGGGGCRKRARRYMHAYEMWNLQAPWEMDNQADKNSGFQTISYAARCSSDLQAKLNQDQRC